MSSLSDSMIGRTPVGWAWTAGPYASPAWARVWAFMRTAVSRTFCTAGSNSAHKRAMMATTNNSSISVNADRRRALMARLGEGCEVINHREHREHREGNEDR